MSKVYEPVKYISLNVQFFGYVEAIAIPSYIVDINH